MVRIWRAGDQLPAQYRSALPGYDCLALTLQDIQAYSAQSVNVGVVDLGQESYFRWSHGVVVGEEQLESKGATWFEIGQYLTMSALESIS